MSGLPSLLAFILQRWFARHVRSRYYRAVRRIDGDTIELAIAVGRLLLLAACCVLLLALAVRS